MSLLRLMACSIAAFAALISAGHAGPCAVDIDTMQRRIDARLEATAAAGPFMREGAFAGMGDQPTPRSIAAVEARRGEISAHKVAAVRRPWRKPAPPMALATTAHVKRCSRG
jgi:hypothetical protein